MKKCKVYIDGDNMKCVGIVRAPSTSGNVVFKVSEKGPGSRKKVERLIGQFLDKLCLDEIVDKDVIKSSLKLYRSLKRGNPKARQMAMKIKGRAKQGDPIAKDIAYTVARMAHKNIRMKNLAGEMGASCCCDQEAMAGAPQDMVKGFALLAKARRGDAESKTDIKMIKSLAKAGSPKATLMLQDIKGANDITKIVRGVLAAPPDDSAMMGYMEMGWGWKSLNPVRAAKKIAKKGAKAVKKAGKFAYKQRKKIAKLAKVACSASGPYCPGPVSSAINKIDKVVSGKGGALGMINRAAGLAAEGDPRAIAMMSNIQKASSIYQKVGAYALENPQVLQSAPMPPPQYQHQQRHAPPQYQQPQYRPPQYPQPHQYRPPPPQYHRPPPQYGPPPPQYNAPYNPYAMTPYRPPQPSYGNPYGPYTPYPAG